MRITLRLSDGLTSDQGVLNIVTLEDTPFMIGRSPQADWTLSDPSNRISGVHLELRRDGEDLLLIDRSSGGTSLNMAANRLQNGQPTSLPDSCQIILPVGGMSLSVERNSGKGRVSLDETDPDDEDFFGLNEIKQERRAKTKRGPVADPAGLLFDEPKEEDEMSLLAGDATGGGGETGGAQMDGWLPDPSDLLGGDAAPTPRAAPRQAARPAAPKATPAPAEPRASAARTDTTPPRPTPPRPPVARETPVGDSWLDEDDDDDLFGTPPADVAEDLLEEPAPTPVEDVEPVAPPVEEEIAPAVAVSPRDLVDEPAQPAPPPPPSPGAIAALDALCAELGITLDDLSPEDQARMGAEIGQTFAAMADAMRLMMQTRAEVKRALGIVATEVEIGANPLKMAPNKVAAVDGLLRPLSSGYLSGEAAVDDTLRSMQAHQHALVSGIKAALQTSLKAFDPILMESKLETGSMSRLVPAMRKAALWDSFTENYTRFTEQAQENFTVVIGRELDRLYHAHKVRKDPLSDEDPL